MECCDASITGISLTPKPPPMESLGGFRDGSITLTSTWTSERIFFVADRLSTNNFCDVDIDPIEQK